MRFSLTEARNAAAEGDFDTALLHFLSVLRWICPSQRGKYSKEFTEILRGFLRDDAHQNRGKLAMLAMSRELYPDEPALLNIAAEFLFSSGRYLEAFDVACRACTSTDREERLHALVNRENIKSNIMDQWHWAMLNDASRNEGYAQAIRLALEQRTNAHVLDIGAGTAFLSMIARSYSSNVYCCEVDENICLLAQRVAAGSGVHLMNKHSTHVSSDDMDSEKADVLVTETMDSGLLGEGIVSTLLDAHQRLLSSTSSVIPNGAIVYACLVECQAITDEHIAIVKGCRFTSPYVHAEPGAKLAEGCEPYWCCYANELKGGFKYLSESVPILSIDFQDVSQLERILNGTYEEHTLVVNRQGRVHAIMIWFRCILFPGAPVLSTNVDSNSCWQQAIYPIEEPFVVVCGSQCRIRVDAYRDRLCCEIVRYSAARENDRMNDEMESGHEEDNRSASEERPLRSRSEIGVDEPMFCSEERCEQNLSWASDGSKQQINYSDENGQEKDCAKVWEDIEVEQKGASVLETEHEIAAVPTVILHSTDFLFLNDSLLVRFFARCLSALIQPGTQFERGDMSLVDITDVASISGSLASYNENYRVICYYQMCDYPTIIDAFQTRDRCILHAFDGMNGFPCGADILLCWPITSTGTFCEHSLSRIVEWKVRNPAGIVIPSVVHVRAQLVGCPKIVRRSKPQKSAHKGVDLSVIDELAISYYYDIEPSTLEYSKLSRPFDLLTLHFDSELPTEAGLLPDFLQQVDVHSEVSVCSSGMADGLLFWFECVYGSECYNVLSDETNARCAMYLLEQSRNVNCNEQWSLLLA
uniref:Protein arginine N-methyltransferase 10 n=1 Tax=Ascaris suum TaxID=6253 RepID=F1KVV2_ASCSU